ncbi:MAG: NUDIX hydrolase [Pseudomonadota bacterium]
MTDRTSPAITVGVGVVVFRDRDVLLIRRGKPPFLGQWSIPGGRLEFAEPLMAAALREVREETAIEARVTGLIGAFEALPSVTGDPARHMVMIDYAAEWLSGEPAAGDDAAEAQFFAYDDALRKVAWDDTRRAVEMAAAMM